MKPRFQCTECQSEIPWGVEVCPSCSTPVEWPDRAETEPVVADALVDTKCPTCGSANSVEAAFCGSCGAQLRGQGKASLSKQQARAGQKQGKPRVEKKRVESTTPMFSWKIIFGFLAVLLILVIVIEFYSSRGQQPSQPSQPTQPTGTAPQAPSANMQLVSQINELEKQVAANPSDIQSLLTLANVCQDGRFFDKAIVHYRKYLEKNPRNANARVDMGICFFETSNLDEASKEMKLALKYEPKHVAAHFNLGIVSLRGGKVQEANEWFKKTIALSPSSDMGQQAKQILEQHSSPLLQNK